MFVLLNLIVAIVGKIVVACSKAIVVAAGGRGRLIPDGTLRLLVVVVWNFVD